MAIWSIPSPGKKNGPCMKDCKHTDCKSSREMASCKCTTCGGAIGYDTAFYLLRPDVVGNNAKEQHLRCAE